MLTPDDRCEVRTSGSDWGWRDAVETMCSRASKITRPVTQYGRTSNRRLCSQHARMLEEYRAKYPDADYAGLNFVRRPEEQVLRDGTKMLESLGRKADYWRKELAQTEQNIARWEQKMAAAQAALDAMAVLEEEP
jgi:hypothetical protein